MSKSNTLNKEYNLKIYRTDFLYGITLCVIFAACMEIFFRQTIRFNGKYVSDTYLYANKGDDFETNRAIFVIFNKLGKINGETFEMALFMAAVIVGTVIGSYLLLRYMTDVSEKRWVLQIGSLLALFTGPIYIPVVYEHFYMGAMAKFAWHSPTQQLMLMCALASLLLFFMLYENYMEHMNPAVWVMFTLFTLASAWAKPAYILTFAPVVLVRLIVDFFSKKEYSYGRRLIRIILLGLAVVPAGLLVLYTNFMIYEGGASSESDVQIVVEFGYFLFKSESPVLMILLSLALPIFVYGFNLPKLKEVNHQVIMGIFIVGMGMYLFLIESGGRTAHGNMGWGRQCATFILFIGAMALLIRNFRDKDFLGGKKILRRVYFIIAGILLVAHFLSAAVYFYLVFKGYLYRR